MSDGPDRQVTLLLDRIGSGDRRASEQLLPLVYEELRKLARAKMSREKPGHTLQPTGLVHEAYLRLVGDGTPQWENRGHFFAAAAEAMRRILIERARRVASEKHGGAAQRITFDEALPVDEEERSIEMLAVDEALQKLQAQDASMAAVVKLRYFAGLSIEETAAAMESSPRTVTRLWSAARAWIRREISASC